nr:hypothetical protein [Taibaiella helva]
MYEMYEVKTQIIRPKDAVEVINLIGENEEKTLGDIFKKLSYDIDHGKRENIDLSYNGSVLFLEPAKKYPLILWPAFLPFRSLKPGIILHSLEYSSITHHPYFLKTDSLLHL